MTDYLKSKWLQASGRVKIALLLLLSVLGISVVFALASGALDSDSDGISDSYEQFFGLDYTNAADALLNYDSDILLNIQESEAGVDPFRKDTDADAWADGIDQAVSRAFLSFEPRFIYGDHYLYPMPAYVKAVYKTGGFFTNGAWHVEENVKESKGRKGDNEQGKGHKFPISNFEFPVSSLVIELDRSLLTNNLLLEIELTKHRASGLYIDLANTQGVAVARNLCGNLSGGNGERDRLLIELPLADYPQASKLILRRGKGEVTVFEMLAYIDRDSDALDSEQETQIGSSDTPVSDWDEDEDVRLDDAANGGRHAVAATGSGFDGANPSREGIPGNPSTSDEDAEDRPKIVLDLVFDGPDPFSPALGALRLFGEYRILPTDALFSEAVRLRNMEGRLPRRPPEPSAEFQFYVRQTITILDASSNVAWSAVSDFSISPSNIWFPGHYAHVGTETAWDGKGIGESLLPDGAYRYRIKGTYLRVKADALEHVGVQRRRVTPPSDSEGRVIRALQSHLPETPVPFTMGRDIQTAVPLLGGVSQEVPLLGGVRGGSNANADAKVKEKIIAVSSTLQGTVLLDATPPITEATVTPMPNAHGWHKDDVTVQLTAHDNLSGIATVYYSINGGAIERGASVTLAEEGVYTVSFWSVDMAGNTEPANSITIRIDKTAPEIAVAGRLPAANNWGWNNTPVTVTYSVSDALSGVNVAVDGYEPDTVSRDGANQSVSATVTDLAGNTTTITLAGINIDLTPPEIASAITGTQGSNNWWVSEATVSYTVSDALSGIDPLLGNHTADILGEGTNQAAQGDVYDKAGNHASTQVTGISVDLTSPAITASIVPEPNAAGWHNEDVTVQLTATDNLSGVAATYFSINGETTKSGASVTLAEEGVHTITYWSVDMAGNVEPAKSITIRIDKTAPEIFVASRLPAANGYGWNNAPVTVTYSVSDALSGVDAALGGYEPDTMSAEGANQSVSGSVADLAGNTSSVSLDNINIDFTSPEILSFSPDDGEIVENPLRPITIAFQESLSGLDAGSLALALDGSNVTPEAILTATSIAYQVSLEFLEGSHIVAVALADLAGNSIAEQITFESDSDGLPNAWELLHFGTLATRPEEDADSDGLSNVAEFQADIDPTDADTDNDGFRDSADVVPISRAVFHWGEPRFVAGDELLGFFPDWVVRAWKEGGEWESWHVSATNEEGYGALFIYLDRDIITNDAIMKIDFVDHSGSSLFIDILYREITTNWQGGIITNHREVATNLYGNIIAGSGIPVQKTYDLPLVANPAVDTIRLRRGIGEITISNTDVYVDQDRDGLDLLQEQALNTSDLNADSDSDGLGDFAEITIHGTIPSNSDTDGDGIHDGTELQFGNDPASSNTYSVLPFIERFETNTVVVGDLNGQNNWTAAPPNTAFVQTNTVYEGAQALAIATPTDQWCEVRQMLASSATNIVWVDLYVQVIPSTAPTDRVDRSAEIYFNEQGRLVVYDGKLEAESAWVTLTNHTPLVTGTWVRLSMKMDYSLQEWLVCLNDYVVADGLGFATQRNEFVAMGIEAQEAFADNITVSTNVPEGVSADWDTLPDAWELQHFGSLAQTDIGDPDTDGLDNFGEFNARTNPNNPDTDGDELPDGWEAQYGFDPRTGLSFSTNLVGWWRFEEDVGPVVLDSSGYGNHGRATNMDTWPRVPGYPIGWALEFDGVDDEVVVPHDDTLMPTSAITISVWMYADPASDGGALITKGFGYRLFGGKDWAAIDFYNEQSGDFAGAGIEFPTGKWVNIAAVYDGTNVGIYANGLAGTGLTDGADPLGPNETDVVIGGWADSPYAHYAGMIADIRLYDTALSPEAVSSLAESGADPDSDGLNNLNEFRHGTDPANPDTDGDGAYDGREVSAGFDPLSPNSLPVNISGAVTYSGWQPGAIYVAAVTAANDWAANYSATLSDPGAYRIFDAPGRTDLWVRAFRDLNTNGLAESFEAYGEYALNPVHATGDISGIVIELSDPDLDHDNMPDWWEVWHWGNTGQVADADFDGDGLSNLTEYGYRTDPTNPDTDGDGFADDFEVERGTDPLDSVSLPPVQVSGSVTYAGKATGTIYIVAVLVADAWESAYSTNIALPGPYTLDLPGLPNFRLKAYRDIDGDTVKQSWEPSAEHALYPIFSDSDLVIDLTLTDPDIDSDGLPDWWEMEHFGNTDAASSETDSDQDGLSNAEEYESNTDPLNPDTDGDWLYDVEEVRRIGFDPLDPDMDKDGYADGIEVRFGSDPHSAASVPHISIWGTVLFSGAERGPIRIVLSTNFAGWAGFSVTVSAPGESYAFNDVPFKPFYWLNAHMDVNTNGVIDAWEPLSIGPAVNIAMDNLNIDIPLIDVDTDDDRLPDDWEWYYFGNLAQDWFIDFDHDGIDNATESQAGTDPAGLWLEGAGKDSATVRWNLPIPQGITFYSYDLFEDAAPHSSSGPFGDSTTTSAKLGGLTPGKTYRIEMRANSASGVLWSKTLEWIQQGLGDAADISYWALFPAVAQRDVDAGTPSVIMTTEVELSDVGSDLVWFFISSNPAASGGWRLYGLRLEAVRGEQTYMLTDYNHNSADGSMKVDFAVIGDGQGKVQFRLRYDGRGRIGIDGPLYLLKWTPTLRLQIFE